MFGMLGGSAGQFAVGPLIHVVIPWQHFWLIVGAVLLVVAVIVLVTTPAGHDARPSTGGSWLSMFKPYKTVLSNPQSYLCGLTARLLFLSTTIGDMIWGVPFLRDGLGVGYAEAVNRASMVPLGWVIRWTAQNPDTFFQVREAVNVYYDRLPGILDAAMQPCSASAP